MVYHVTQLPEFFADRVWIYLFGFRYVYRLKLAVGVVAADAYIYFAFVKEKGKFRLSRMVRLIKHLKFL